MNPWIAKAVILAASIVMVAIRAPHGQRSRGVKVVKNRKGRQEVILLTLAWLGFFVPLVWVGSPASRLLSIRFDLIPSSPGSYASWLASGSSTGRTRTLERTGQSRFKSVNITNSSRMASISASATRCTRRSFSTRLARYLSFRIGLLVRRTWSRLGFSSRLGSAMRRG